MLPDRRSRVLGRCRARRRIVAVFVHVDIDETIARIDAEVEHGHTHVEAIESSQPTDATLAGEERQDAPVGV